MTAESLYGGLVRQPRAADTHALAEAYVAKRRRNNWIFALVGIVLLVGGFAGFGVFGSRQDALAAHGVHAMAVVVGGKQYNGGGGGATFDEHLDVVFTATDGTPVRARVWIGEDTNYRLGQQVEIVYDQNDPGRAQLAHGADLGPVGAPLLIAMIFGGVFAGVGVARVRACRAARRALRTQPRRVPVTGAMLRRGRGRALAVFVGGVRPLLAFWSLTRSDWHEADDAPADADVYGELRPGSVLVVACADGSIALGRTWRRRRRSLRT
jgi:hypothetical protein